MVKWTCNSSIRTCSLIGSPLTCENYRSELFNIQKIPLKSAHLAPQKLWQLVPSVHQGWRKTFNNDKEKKKDARNLGTTADSSTASCSMSADSTSKGPGNIEYTEKQYSRKEELTYSVARRYDEVISAGKEPKIPILRQVLILATRNEVGSPRLALRDRRWDRSRQQSN